MPYQTVPEELLARLRTAAKSHHETQNADMYSRMIRKEGKVGDNTRAQNNIQTSDGNRGRALNRGRGRESGFLEGMEKLNMNDEKGKGQNEDISMG